MQAFDNCLESRICKAIGERVDEISGDVYSQIRLAIRAVVCTPDPIEHALTPDRADAILRLADKYELLAITDPMRELLADRERLCQHITKLEDELAYKRATDNPRSSTVGSA